MNLAELYANPLIHLRDINEPGAIKFHNDLHDFALTKATSLTIVLACYGGNVDVQSELFDTIQGLAISNVEIFILTTGVCKSSAVPLLMAVPLTQRYATQHTEFMIHPISNSKYQFRLHANIDQENATQVSDIKRYWYTRQDQLYIDRLIGGTNLSRPQLEAMLGDTDTIFDAQKALEYGIIGHIL